MSWGFVAAGAATVVGSAIGSKGQKDAAKTQANAANAQAQISKDIYDQTRSDLMPFQNMGVSVMPQLMQTMKPIDRSAALGDFYSSPEYAMMSQQGANQQLAAGEAMGGMGSTSMGNSLASISPQLGMQHLGMLEGQRADQYNQLMGIAGMGQNAAAQMGTAGSNYASQAGNAYQQAGAANAASQMGQANMWGQTIGSLGGLAYQSFNQPSSSSSSYEQGMGTMGYNSMGGF
ncbi:hypothetical protein NVP1061O_14 [Vibrio phage 1.061.O._10N.286.55.C2]|nr:hypothetical protein NVP1061O_14 [Vibrio phage 1.061.O._10N.286.55.C2]